MVSKPRPTLASYTLTLLSEGRTAFLREEAEQALGIGRGAFLDAAEGLQKKGGLLRPRHGFYVVVPPQFLSWGAPPPPWYIADLMRREGRPYYVGLLKAAELHGASHQAVMEFQVVTDRRIPEIRVGRSLLAFYYRRDMAAVAGGVEERKTDTGKMKLSSVELTAFDLLRYPHAAGGLGNVSTVFSELGAKIDPEKLAALAPAFERSVMQRLGHLLGRSGNEDRTMRLYRHLSSGPSIPWVELNPGISGDPDALAGKAERDERWRVIVRQPAEADA